MSEAPVVYVKGDKTRLVHNATARVAAEFDGFKPVKQDEAPSEKALSEEAGDSKPATKPATKPETPKPHAPKV